MYRYASYGKVVMGSVFGAGTLVFLFYISWLRRVEEGDVVLYRLDSVISKIHPDDQAVGQGQGQDEENQINANKRKFSTKSLNWYHFLKNRKLKKKLGLAVVVRGHRCLQLRPLRRLYGYLVPDSDNKSVLSPIQGGSGSGNDDDGGGGSEPEFHRKGYATEDPSSWLFVEEEDDECILNMTMFSIHTVVYNISAAEVVDKTHYLYGINGAHQAQAQAQSPSIIRKRREQIHPISIENSPLPPLLLRNRKRGGKFMFDFKTFLFDRFENVKPIKL